MSPQEAEQIMSPFYPHEAYLAIEAMDKALEGNTPEWILESVVGSFFNFLETQDLMQKLGNKINKLVRLQEKNIDPYGLDTIPYTVEHTGLELN